MIKEIGLMNEKAKSYGRKISYGISAHVVCSDSQEEAEKQADELAEISKKSGVSAIAAKALGGGLSENRN